MRAVKAVKQGYTPSPELLELLNEFRIMVNDCIQIGLARSITSMKALSENAYHKLEGYDAPARYRLTAISKAAGILRNYRHILKKCPRVKKPYASKPMLTDCYFFKIIDNMLRLPVRPGEYVHIPLNAYVLRSIEGYTVRSVCLTACTLSITFSKEITQIEPVGLIGIDCNLDNITTASSDRVVKRYDFSRATEVRENCRQAMRGFRRNDHRVRKQLYSKYGRIQKNKVNWIAHNASSDIVRQAKEKRLGITVESLKGIRRLYRKGNGQGRDHRARMNGWGYAELQRQIEYKADWEGIPVFYVHPSRTSSVCAICSCKVAECSGRRVYCQHCEKLVDRDENAALNILNAGLRFSLKGVAGEARRRNPEDERKEKVIPGVDTTQLSPQSKA